MREYFFEMKKTWKKGDNHYWLDCVKHKEGKFEGKTFCRIVKGTIDIEGDYLADIMTLEELNNPHLIQNKVFLGKENAERVLEEYLK